MLVILPTRLLHSPFVQSILRSPIYAALRNYFVRPAVVTLLLFMVCRLLGWVWSVHAILDVLLVTTLLLNSPVGRYADEWITDSLARAWHDLRIKVLTAAYHWIMDLFHRLAVSLERVVYTVDEWLRFRAGDDRRVEAVKLVAGACWFFVAYVVVFAFTLLIEPQINPIKHFPVVTVSHKLILPTGPVFVEQLEPYIGRAKATTLVWSTIWLIPGVFGFLVWELKGNWRLYAANRPSTLLPVSIGRHGETMASLLRPGFHSGTLPKLYAGLRRASRKAQRSGDWKPVDRKRLQLQRVQEAIRRFVQRDLIALLSEARFLPGVTVGVGRIRVATNRIDVEITRSDQPANPVQFTWDEIGGRLVGEVSRPGWLELLHASDRTTFVRALSGLCARAGVEEMRGPVNVSVTPPLTWDRWLSYWAARRADA